MLLAALPFIVAGCGKRATKDDVPEPLPLSVERADSDLPGPVEPRDTLPENDADGEFRSLLAAMGVDLDADGKKFSIKGWVNMQTGLVEVFACAPEGKTHEAVVVLDCIPSGFHAGLLALGLTPGTPVEVGTDGDYTRPTGDGVEIRVRWKNADGVDQIAHAEDWVWDKVKEASMPRSAWIFAGSFLQEAPGSPGDQTYAANYVKSLVTTYHDASSVVENPHNAGIDDTIYFANDKSVPDVGTPLTVEFSRTTKSSP